MPAAQQKKAQQFDFHKYLGVFWRRKWFLIIPLLICAPAAFLIAWNYPTEYESKAIIEIQDARPIGDAAPVRYGAGSAVMAVRTRAMSWTAIREIVLSRKVDFGREIDPDDRRQLERIYSEITHPGRTSVGTMGGSLLTIAHRSTSPARNAALVNEIVKKFVGEERREAQEKAKQDLKYYRDKLATAKTALTDIDNQLREFSQQNPWLSDKLAEIQKDYENAEAEELSIRRQLKANQEMLDELKKDLQKVEPEIVTKRRGEIPAEVIEVRKALEHAKQSLEQAQRHFEQVDKSFTRAHPRWGAAKAFYDNAEKAAAELKAKDKKDPEEIKTTEPNPKHADIQARVTRTGKEKDQLDARRLETNKRVQELYVRRRKAPELLGERGALSEQRTTAASTAAEYDRGVRVADKELARLLSEAYSSRFVVREYARDDFRPVRSTQMKIITIGLVVGLLIGAGLVGLIEYLDQTFKSIDDTRDYLGIPALGVIPAIFTPRDHRRKLLFRVLALSSAVFVVGVAVAIYLTVPEMKNYLNGAWVTFKEWVEVW